MTSIFDSMQRQQTHLANLEQQRLANTQARQALPFNVPLLEQALLASQLGNQSQQMQNQMTQEGLPFNIPNLQAALLASQLGNQKTQQEMQFYPQSQQAQIALQQAQANALRQQAQIDAFKMQNPFLLSPNPLATIFMMKNNGNIPGNVTNAGSFNPNVANPVMTGGLPAPQSEISLSGYPGSVPTTENKETPQINMSDIRKTAGLQGLDLGFTGDELMDAWLYKQGFAGPVTEANLKTQSKANERDKVAYEKIIGNANNNANAASDALSNLELFHKEYKQANAKGPIVGGLSRWDQHATAAESAAAELVQGISALRGGDKGATDALRALVEKSKPHVGMPDYAENVLYNKLKNTLTRASLESEFMARADASGVPHKYAQTMWSQFQRDFPIHGTEEDALALEYLGDYLTPSAINNVLTGKHQKPQSRASSSTKEASAQEIEASLRARGLYGQ